MKKQETVVIIGAGLCGSLLGLRLAQRGFKVLIYERRPDLRKVDLNSGRSINLALSNRGLKALKMCGIEEKVMEICSPMEGRLMHDTLGNTFPSKYSGRGECIYSISRNDLNRMLLKEATTHKNITLHFNKKCLSVDLENTLIEFEDTRTNNTFSVKAAVIFGTDGAGSEVRKSYFLKQQFLFSQSQEYLQHGYKELEIPPNTDGSHQLSKEHLHIWPRGDFMLIALPNLDGSFTATLFLSYSEGKYNFNTLTNDAIIKEFFEKEFPDALALIPTIASSFLKNPTGHLGTVKCSPWHYKNSTLLLGDAAHTIVPFYGQGMNASFEDVTEFDAALNEGVNDWESVFNTYQKNRKKDTDAIADLAIDNFYEMRDHVVNPLFKEKRTIEMALEKMFPKTYYSKYAMVTFREDISYHQAMKKGRAQDKALLNIIASQTNVADAIHDKANLKTLLTKIQEATDSILKEDAIAGL